MRLDTGSYLSLLAATALIGGMAACSDSTSPGNISKPAEDLNVARLAQPGPALLNAEASFYGVRGQDREVRIFLQDLAGGQAEELVLLRVRPASLLSRPDGSPVPPGDSILITVRVMDPANFLFEMEPAGLTFNPAAPAELKIHYNHADHDFNQDGFLNATDDQIKNQLAIWRQESLTDPFVRLGSVNEVNLEEINADILRFSRYAVAY